MNYVNEQLFKAIPMSLTDRNGQIYLKIRTKHGQTNWLNVSPNQMQEIEQILNQEVTA